ncbi:MULTISPECIES: glutamate ABC transporter substrate-binding protein [unclassified Streptomyces]|uniref:glutamate ABC transporter substrate-binding protein n=1 Tax=Streptomycetaceae TaxID=2062 RepID=UPI002E79371D|nr:MULTISPECIES: glutamate ABC transporter substrate-binding protein [unclassified Streptomyces]MED7951159.1 glutamate ABC transporter substrate-binding protein [Streptomyces sp. BE303]MEE1826346.1 glutamate ABC transporter substrate-binding protein [Streptomyces sp. BE20]
MRTRRTFAVALCAVALTATAACGKDGTPGADKASSGSSSAPALPTYAVKSDVKVDSPALAEARKRGQLIIGAKSDQPFLGWEDLATNDRSGFDIEIAKMVAADLGFTPQQIKWQTLVSSQREPAISKGQIDFYVGTYSINDERKKSVSFAGPYYIAGQDLLVKSDNTTITGPESVNGKNVCTATGSTSIKNIQQYSPKITQFDTYSACVEKLMSGEVDAVTTDDAILKGYASKYAPKLKVVGKPFTKENYGVGLNKDDKALRDAISDALKAHQDNGDWKKAYDATLGLSGSTAPQPPALERY